MARSSRLLAFLLSSLTTASAACSGKVTYNVTFTGLWTSGTHPKDYPKNAQWSGLVGQSHNSHYTMWRPGNLSTPAMKELAEDGFQIAFFLKLPVPTVLDRRILSPTRSNSTSSETFRLDGNHSLVSLVAKITPSPDWFAGIHGLNLCNGTAWIQSTTVDLFPYDAGTDSGLTFTSDDEPTDPQEPIYRITGTNPNNSLGSFYGYPTVPRIATLAFVLSTPMHATVSNPTPDYVTIASSAASNTTTTAADVGPTTNRPTLDYVTIVNSTESAAPNTATTAAADAGSCKEMTTCADNVNLTGNPAAVDGSDCAAAEILIVTLMSVVASLV